MFIIKSLKRYSKHLFVLLTVFILIFSFELNVFGATSYTCNLDKGSYTAYVNDTSNPDKLVNVTSSTGRGHVIYLNVPCTVFQYDKQYNSNKKLLMCGSDLPLYSGYQYKFDFSFSGNFANSYSLYVTLWLGSEENSSDFSAIELVKVDDTFFKGYTWYNFSGTFTIPEINGSFHCAILFQINTHGGASTASQRFYISDVNFTIDSPLYGDHYNPPDHNIGGEIDNYEDIINQLPKVDSDNLSDLMSSFDISDFTASFDCFNSVFDTLVKSLNLTQILLFTLTFGLGIYVLGRRLGK